VVNPYNRADGRTENNDGRKGGRPDNQIRDNNIYR